MTKASANSISTTSTSRLAADAFATAPQSVVGNSNTGSQYASSRHHGSSTRSNTSDISNANSQGRLRENNYRPPTVETVSNSSASYRQVPDHDYVIHNVTGSAEDLDAFYTMAPMSGALLPGSYLLLPGVLLNDHVLDASHPIDINRATVATPNSNLPNFPAGPSRPFFWRRASDYMSMPWMGSTTEPIRFREKGSKNLVLSTVPFDETPFNTHKAITKVSELRSNCIGRTNEPAYLEDMDFNWQITYYYNLPPLLPTISEEENQPRMQTSLNESQFFDRMLSGNQDMDAFAHLKYGNFMHRSRHDKGSVTCVDLGVGKSIPRYMASSWGNDDSHVDWDLENTPWDVFQRMLTEPIVRTIHTRLIVVEDLSHETIRFLGNQFNVSPEFFEEHLVNSGYRDGSYEDKPPDSWSTHGLRKTYKSIRWYRPVFRQNVRPISRKSEEDLLSLGHVAYPTQTRQKEIYKTETNIFRPKWELSTSPAGLYGKRLCGWEERASIWSVKMGNTRCVLLILDPLPTLARGGIFRLGDIPGENNRLSEESQNKSSVDEKTIKTNDGAPVDGNLRNSNESNPPPKRRETALEREPIQGRPVPKVPNNFEKFVLRLLKRVRKKVTAEIDEERVPFNPRQIEKTFRKTNTVHLIKQVSTRTQMTDTEYSEAFSSSLNFDHFNDQISVTRSTKAEFLDWLNNPRFHNAHEHSAFGVGSPLLQIIIADTISLCRIIRHGLNQISQDIVEEARMEESLTLWRQYIGRCQRELPELQESVHEFYNALHSDCEETLDNGNQIGSHEIKDLLLDIEKLRDEVAASAASLTSNMSLLDSKRSIAEAQSVKKLTELAFLFIPATFSASLFGMEIEQFSTPAPLWTFIAVAVSFTTFSYFIRLVVRSHTIEGMQLSTTDRIAHYAKAKKITKWRKGQPVPTGLFIKWVLFEIRNLPGLVVSKAGNGFAKVWAIFGFYIASVSMMSIVAVAPLAILLTRDYLNLPIRIGVSVAIIFLSFLLVVVPYWRASSPQFRTALPRLISTYVQRFAGSKYSRQGGWGILGMIVASIPLIIVWTQDLAMGIKAAVTTAVVIGIMCGGAYMLIRRLLSIARDDWEDSDDSSALAED